MAASQRLPLFSECLGCPLMAWKHPIRFIKFSGSNLFLASHSIVPEPHLKTNAWLAVSPRCCTVANTVPSCSLIGQVVDDAAEQLFGN